jgi:hypothetical protein
MNISHLLNRISKALLLAVVCSATVSFAAPPTMRVNPEPSDAGVEIEAKIAKTKAKQGGASGKSNSAQGCGNVNINSNEGKSKPGSGLVGESKTTVIVGDVINTAKCK